MSFEIELEDSTKRIRIETDSELPMLHELVRQIVPSIDALNNAVPLISFIAARDPLDSLKYSYTFTTQDARVFAQIITFSNGVRMTFNVPDGWRGKRNSYRIVPSETSLYCWCVIMA